MRRPAGHCRRSSPGIRLIAAKSTSASPAMAPGIMRARRSAGANSSGCFPPSCAKIQRIYLVTPAEKLRIRVDDAPFVAVLLGVEGEAEAQRLIFTTNVRDETIAGRDNPIRVETNKETGEPAPYVHVAAASKRGSRAASSINWPIWPCPGKTGSSAYGARACSFRLGRHRERRCGARLGPADRRRQRRDIARKAFARTARRAAQAHARRLRPQSGCPPASRERIASRGGAASHLPAPRPFRAVYTAHGAFVAPCGASGLSRRAPMKATAPWWKPRCAKPPRKWASRPRSFRSRAFWTLRDRHGLRDPSRRRHCARRVHPGARRQ